MEGAKATRQQAQESFEQLHRATYWQVVRYFLRRGHGDATARDVTSEVFMAAWRQPQVAEVSLLWLYGVSRNLDRNHRRSERRRSLLLDRLRHQPPPAPGADPSDVVLVRDALSRLPVADQEILMLSSWEGLAPAELAQVLGVSANAASVRLHRARGRLRAMLLAAPVQLSAPIDLSEAAP